MAHEGNKQLNQQLATGKTYRRFDSFTTCREEGCFMGTMRLPLWHQIEQGLLPESFSYLYWKDRWNCAAVHITEYISLSKKSQ